ncbi:hypothetical protein, partial [Mycobacterium tuberculosis]
MARTLALRASAGLVAGMAMAAITLAPGARAETGEQFPGDGVFLVGTDIAPGTYRTEGPSNPLILVFGRVSELSTCSWSTHSAPEVSNENIVDTNTLNRPGMSGDSSSWKGWGHVRWFIEEVPAGA